MGLGGAGKGELLRVQPDGSVTWSRQSSVTLACKMYFGNLPFDEHYCKYTLGMYSQTAAEVSLRWVDGKDALANWQAVSTAEWSAAGMRQANDVQTYATGTYTYALAWLHIKRIDQTCAHASRSTEPPSFPAAANKRLVDGRACPPCRSCVPRRWLTTCRVCAYCVSARVHVPAHCADVVSYLVIAAFIVLMSCKHAPQATRAQPSLQPPTRRRKRGAPESGDFGPSLPRILTATA